MKAITKYQKRVEAANERLTTIRPNAVTWATKNAVEHIAFRTAGHNCACGDCGKTFDYKGGGKYIRCPHCRGTLLVNDCFTRKMKRSGYFSTLEATTDGLQVQRVFLLTAYYKKGEPMRAYYEEVCRLWIDTQGHFAVTSRARALGRYIDTFDWQSDIALRKLAYVHWAISDTIVYPHYSVIPELRRNGMKGRLPQCHPFRLMSALLSDHRMETMMKAKDHKAICHFIEQSTALDRCWQSYKVATRHGYKPQDFGMWCDLIRLLERCGRDTHNTKYICPTDLKSEHDHWLNKLTAMEEKRRSEEQMRKAKEQEADFYAQKSRYFGIVIQDSDIEITVLNSLEAYKAEGETMHHCVFRCEYYAKQESIILSAHDHEGHRIETVEFSVVDGKVIQSRAVCNTNSEYHDRIINLVNANAYRFMEAKATA